MKKRLKVNSKLQSTMLGWVAVGVNSDGHTVGEFVASRSEARALARTLDAPAPFGRWSVRKAILTIVPE